MATTHRDMPCSAQDVGEVLAHGWLFGLWVVGSSRIRDVDAGWPAEGAKIHHSFGVWPVLIDDVSECVAWQPDRRLALLARGWPAGEASVELTIEDRAAGCRVTMTEDAVKGPGTLIPRPLRSIVLNWRNTEALRRLEYLAVGRAGRRIEPRSPDGGPAPREEHT